MRISELSQAAGVPVPTIKYYLREGLLPPGETTAPNQADYDDRHAQRLRLVRVLREVGGLGIEAIRAVLEAVDDPDRSIHQVLGVAHHALSPTTPTDEPPPELAEVDALLERLGWEVSPSAPDRWALAEALRGLRRLGRDVEATTFLPHAHAAEQLAAVEVGSLDPTGERGEVVERAVVGTVVYEAAFTALRRLAQEHHSALRTGASDPST
jgi:DNA-binding transcriptional MerR regulator